MHPVLFKIGGLTFYTYGLLMALGFIAAYFLLLRLARVTKQDGEFYSNMFFWMMVLGILGAKALYLLVGIRDLGEELKDVVGCLRGGLVWYGGLIADIIFVYFYSKSHQKSYLQVADTATAPTALGLAIGRIGCLMAGCCYGKPSELPWAITYPPGETLPHPMAGIPVHPSPIYEAAGVLVIAVICWQLLLRSRRRGMALAMLVMLYALLRFGLEFLRGDLERGVLFGSLSTSQFVSILMFALAIGLLAYILKKPPEAEKQAPPPPPSRKEKKKKAKEKVK